MLSRRCVLIRGYSIYNTRFRVIIFSIFLALSVLEEMSHFAELFWMRLYAPLYFRENLLISGFAVNGVFVAFSFFGVGTPLFSNFLIGFALIAKPHISIAQFSIFFRFSQRTTHVTACGELPALYLTCSVRLTSEHNGLTPNFPRRRALLTAVLIRLRDSLSSFNILRF